MGPEWFGSPMPLTSIYIFTNDAAVATSKDKTLSFTGMILRELQWLREQMREQILFYSPAEGKQDFEGQGGLA